MVLPVGVAVGCSALTDDKLVPLQLYTLVFAPGLAVRVTAPPLQIYPLLVGAADGVAFTVTDVVYIVDGLQPASAVPSVTRTEYTPLAVGVAVGFSLVDVKPPGPDQLYVLAPLPGFADKATVPPMQIGPSFVGAAVGVGLTDTVVT